MSNTSDITSCLSHRELSHFFVLYEDFLELAVRCKSTHDYKLAALWRVLETKTNDRISYLKQKAIEEKQPEPQIEKMEIWVEVSYSEFAHRALGLYKQSSFQIAAAESERLGFTKSKVLKRKIDPTNPESAEEEYKVYLLHLDRMNKALKGGDLPTPGDFNSPLLKRKKAIPPSENNSPPLLKSPAPPVTFNSPPLLKVTGNNIREKNISNIRESIDSSASAEITPPVPPENEAIPEPEEEQPSPPPSNLPLFDEETLPPVSEKQPIPIVATAPIWNTNACRAMFTEWRGFPLLNPKLDSQSAKYLSENFSREVVTAAHDYMTTDPFWSKGVGGDIAAVARNMSTVLTQLGITDPKGNGHGFISQGQQQPKPISPGVPAQPVKPVRTQQQIELLELERRFKNKQPSPLLQTVGR